MSEFLADEWGAAPSESRWYGEVICVPIDGGDVDYFFGYSSSDEEADIGLLVPDGWRMLECKIEMTPGHPQYVPSNFVITERVRGDGHIYYGARCTVCERVVVKPMRQRPTVELTQHNMMSHQSAES